MEVRDNDLFMIEAKKRAKGQTIEDVLSFAIFLIVAFLLIAILASIEANVSIIIWLSSQMPLPIYCLIGSLFLDGIIYDDSRKTNIQIEYSKIINGFNNSLISSMLEHNNTCPIVMINAKDDAYGDYVFKQATDSTNVLEASLIFDDNNEEMVQIYS